jgi:hypothetical protein
LTLQEKIEKNQTLWALGFLFSGFLSGIGTYTALLEITNQETVVKGTTIKASNLVGNILKTEVIKELEHMIEIGRNIDAIKNPSSAGVYLSRTRAFLQGLDLPKDKDHSGTQLSYPVFDHQMIMMRNRWYGHEEITLSEQVARVLGILEGMKASYLSSDVDSPAIIKGVIVGNTPSGVSIYTALAD